MKIVYKILLLLPLMSMLTVGCRPEVQQRPPAPTPQLPVLELSTGVYSGKKAYPTNIEGKQNIEIRAKVSGYIQQIFVDEGQPVRKGAALFKLETATLTQDASAAQAAIQTVESRIEAARLEVQRLGPLVEKDVISEVQLATARANLKAIESELNQAKSSHEGVKANIGYTNIVSPVSGVIGMINLRQGSLVSATTSTPLTTVSNIEEVYAYISMNEGDFLELTRSLEGATMNEKLKLLPPVSLVLADGTTYEKEGRIDAVSGSIDSRTGAIRLRAVFENPNGLIRNGSSGTIIIPQVYEDQIAIPALSTFEQQGKRMVFVLTEGDTIRARSIEVLDEIEHAYVVKGGVSVGDKILAMGVAKVRPGTKIVPQETTYEKIINSYETVFK